MCGCWQFGVCWPLREHSLQGTYSFLKALMVMENASMINTSLNGLLTSLLPCAACDIIEILPDWKTVTAELVLIFQIWVQQSIGNCLCVEADAVLYCPCIIYTLIYWRCEIRHDFSIRDAFKVMHRWSLYLDHNHSSLQSACSVVFKQSIHSGQSISPPNTASNYLHNAPPCVWRIWCVLITKGVAVIWFLNFWQGWDKV